MDLEHWMWKEKKIRIRGAEPNKLRLSTPYYLSKQDIDRFLEAFDEYKKSNGPAERSSASGVSIGREKTLIRAGLGKGTTSVVPFSCSDLLALQRPRHAF
jgi:hypothetical protein